MEGQDWETSLHFLAGRLVTVARSPSGIIGGAR